MQRAEGASIRRYRDRPVIGEANDWYRSPGMHRCVQPLHLGIQRVPRRAHRRACHAGVPRTLPRLHGPVLVLRADARQELRVHVASKRDLCRPVRGVRDRVRQVRLARVRGVRGCLPKMRRAMPPDERQLIGPPTGVEIYASLLLARVGVGVCSGQYTRCRRNGSAITWPRRLSSG